MLQCVAACFGTSGHGGSPNISSKLPSLHGFVAFTAWLNLQVFGAWPRGADAVQLQHLRLREEAKLQNATLSVELGAEATKSRGFQKWRVSKMDGFYGKIPSKWMI